MARVAINGMGRIGRAAFKIILDTPDLELVAVNSRNDSESLAYLLTYDSVYGRYERNVTGEGDSVRTDGRACKVTNESDPARFPWGELTVDIVFDCTGLMDKKEELEKHLAAGAKKVILSAPAKGEGVDTVVPGVNWPEPSARIVSCASCTTNSIAPVMEVLGRRIGLKKSIMTTIHAYTASQALVDRYQKKLRRGRAAAANIVPTSTGAARATGTILTELAGKFDGMSMRVPVLVGSVSDIVVLSARKTSREEVNSVLREESESARYKDILGVTDDPVVSSDIIKDTHAALVDLELTQVVDGDLVKVFSWYDNEWGYASQMIRAAVRMAQAL